MAVDLDRMSTMSPEELWELIRQASRRALSSPAGRPITGVLGPEFTEEERS
jgi:hypothetical protein